MVVMIPLADTLRIRLPSAMNRSPARSTATGFGPFSRTLVAGPPSPETAVPPPATVVMIPLAATLRIRLDAASVMYKLPARSTATAAGGDNVALAAGPPSPSGKQPIFPGQPMPATVVMVPLGETLRTLELLLSAMNTLP